ncbi:DNA-directed RNA polymerase subunit K [Sulfolobales archaeon HS-7]|nr:DNA-directed RNA polymerase subunit K [Sulfolobales archaeon HS-7]
MRFWLTDSELTKYERARIIGTRALQLSMGAIPLLDESVIKGLDTLAIAELELERGVLPITIRRRLPNGEYQLISITRLFKKNE